jgi:hypothetical protein
LANPFLAEVAKHSGVSRTRVYQMLNLLKLDKRIVNYVANITDPKIPNDFHLYQPDMVICFWFGP